MFELNLNAYNAYEYLPFIEAYARTDDWETARTLTAEAYALQYTARPVLCRLWTDLMPLAPPDQQAAIEALQTDLNCPGL